LDDLHAIDVQIIRDKRIWADWRFGSPSVDSALLFFWASSGAVVDLRKCRFPFPAGGQT
jgi:hypothetical protein